MIVAFNLLDTAGAVTRNVPVVCPDGTDIVAGTVTPAVSDDSPTVNPAGGAGVVIVTDPVIVPPPYAGLGAIENVVMLIALIVNVAVAELAPAVPVIVAEVAVPVTAVLTLNVAVVCPDATVTDGTPTVAAAELDDRLTFTPAAGALAERVTVPVDE